MQTNQEDEMFQASNMLILFSSILRLSVLM